MPKTTRQKVTAKAKPLVKKATVAAKKTVAKGKAVAKTAVKKVAPKAKAAAKKTAKKADGIMNTVTGGVASGLKSVGKFVKKITPDALLPKSPKSKRK